MGDIQGHRVDQVIIDDPALGGPTGAERELAAVQARATAKMAEITALEQANAAREREIASMGKSLAPHSVQAVRLQMALDFLLGGLDGTPPGANESEFWRLDYELLVQRKFAEMLDAVVSQVTRAKLTEGVPVGGMPAAAVPASKLIVPGR